MINPAQWLDDNMDDLVQAALNELSQDTGQQSQATRSVMEFFEGVFQSAHQQDLTPLFNLLDEWVSVRSAPTEDELNRLLPVVVKFKEVNSRLICDRCTAEDAVGLLRAMEKLYNPALIYLSNLEAEAVLDHMRTELRHAKAQLERLEKSKSDFVEVAAHELRTPITLVEGYTNMLWTSIPGIQDDPVAMPLIMGIEGGVHRLKGIIRDMLDVSLISLGMIDLHLQSTWLIQLLQAVEQNVQMTLVDRQIELVVDYDTIPHEPILGDPERLLQVFQKIVSNAIKYTPDGGQVRIMARDLTSFTDVMVIDNGIGIDSENLTRIFGMFSSLSDSSLHSTSQTRFRGDGPGLGLFISKGLIEAHGGNIWAESEGYDENRLPGSTFHIMIPMRSASSDDKITSAYDNSD